MPPPPQGQAPRTIVVGSFTQDGRHYEQRLVNCGKLGCTKCGPPHDRHPSHGPYWYLCVSHRGSWTRIYLGKDLDTTRYIGPDGAVDWSLVHDRNKRRPKADFSSPDSPGQVDMLDHAALPPETPST